MTTESVKTDAEGQLSRIAAEVRLRRLEAPAIFFLEMSKPLCGMAAAAMAVSRPMMVVLFGQERSAAVEQLIESRENVERLIALLEEGHGR